MFLIVVRFLCVCEIMLASLVSVLCSSVSLSEVEVFVSSDFMLLFMCAGADEHNERGSTQSSIPNELFSQIYQELQVSVVGTKRFSGKY